VLTEPINSRMVNSEALPRNGVRGDRSANIVKQARFPERDFWPRITPVSSSSVHVSLALSRVCPTFA
jgi:hypothetical protein